MSDNLKLDALNYLLKAPSKSLVLQLIKLCFSSRNFSPQPSIYAIKTLLDITAEEAKGLFRTLSECVSVCLMEGTGDALTTLFEGRRGDHVDPRLKVLLTTIITGELDGWLGSTFLKSVSLPAFKDMKWGIQSQEISKNVVTVPLVVIKMEMKEEEIVGENHVTKNFDLMFETDGTSLDLLLDKFRKIKDQISLLDK